MVRIRWPSLLVGALVAVAAYVLVAPLGCQPAVEVVGAGQTTTVTEGRAGPVTCTRLLLPDYTADTEPARWPAILAAAALGVMASLAVQGRGSGKGTAPPPGEAG